MKIVNLTQGTPEWHEFRRGGIGSSEIHGLLTSEPFSPYWEKLKKEKLTGETNDFQTEAMKLGKEGEIQAIRSMQKTNPNLAPVCAIHEEHTFIRCSFDAIYGKEIYEIKTPQPQMLEKCLLGEAPEKWVNQLRWQMVIADAPHGNLAIWDGHSAHFISFDRDLGWDKKAIKIATQFWDWVQDGIVPDAKYISIEDSLKETLIEDYRRISQMVKELEEEKERLKKQIVDGMDRDFILDGSKIFQTSTTSYDYKKMVSDFNISLDSYKKQSKPFWKIAL